MSNKLCFESVEAREICLNNNIKWTNLNINNFRKYDYESWKWNGGLGGLNGGYAYLAINKFMKKKNKNDYLVLSGFVGDLLSGKFLREKNLTLNNCITKTSMNMPPFLRDSIYAQNQFQLKIIKWLELGNLHNLNNNEMLCIGKVQYLSFLWKCYSDNEINFLTLT